MVRAVHNDPGVSDFKMEMLRSGEFFFKVSYVHMLNAFFFFSLNYIPPFLIRWTSRGCKSATLV